jgi:MFS family permease
VESCEPVPVRQSGAVPVRRLWGAVLCGYLALGGTLQELPGYLADRFGAGPALTGLAVGLAFAATALGRPFAGLAGDLGWSRPVVILGAGLTTLGALGHLFAPTVGVVLAARLVMGAGEAALFSGALPWVLSGTPAGRGGRVAGWFGLSMWGGLALGPLLAVAAHRVGGAAAVWWLVAALPVVSTVLVASTRRPVLGGGGRAVRVRSWWDLVPRGTGLPGLCLGLAAYGYGTLGALLVLYLGGQHPGGAGVHPDGQPLGGESVALTVYAAAFLLTRGVGSPLIDRYGGARVASLVLGLAVAGLALLAAVPAEAAALTGTALAGVGLGLVYPATTAMTLHRTTRSPGLAVAAMTSLWDLGILAAGPIGGVLAGHVGYRPAFAVAAGVVALALAIALGSVRAGPATRPAG